ncbi:putative T7SS-secreted protein [Nocardia aurantia]|uniref:Type IV secretion protein Rhs n=1 Tax=Nocardia aurantia TaxID=2585199 RepID=A0A7K0DH72_9NOCA|nr:DUF6531 domain-containing protein [Nocardia aurantia]MQY25039.1 hypothetical protein [Nocardia aurantia]
MGWLDDIGDAAEHVAHRVEQATGQAVDATMHGLGSLARDVGADGVAANLDRWGDEAADALDAEAPEKQLGQTDDPKQLIHGDAAAIGHAADLVRKMGDSVDKTGQALKAIDVADWTGKGANAFHTTFGKQPRLWFDGADAMHQAATILTDWSHAVTTAQGHAADAITTWKQADTEERRRKTWWNNLSADEQRRTTLTDTWTTLRDNARAILNRARTDRDNAAGIAVSGLQAATAKAPETPSFTDRMRDNLSDAADVAQFAGLSFDKGLLTSFTGLVQFVRQVDPMDPYNLTHPAAYFEGMSDLDAGLVVAMADPKATVEGLLSGARTDPAEWLGNITGQVVMTVGTGGAGGAEAATNVAREAATVAREGATAAREGATVARDGATAARDAATAAETAPKTAPTTTIPKPETPRPPEPARPIDTARPTDGTRPTDTRPDPTRPADGSRPDTARPTDSTRLTDGTRPDTAQPTDSTRPADTARPADSSHPDAPPDSRARPADGPHPADTAPLRDGTHPTDGARPSDASRPGDTTHPENSSRTPDPSHPDTTAPRASLGTDAAPHEPPVAAGPRPEPAPHTTETPTTPTEPHSAHPEQPAAQPNTPTRPVEPPHPTPHTGTQPTAAHPDPVHPTDTAPHTGTEPAATHSDPTHPETPHTPEHEPPTDHTPSDRADADHGAHSDATEAGPKSDRTPDDTCAGRDPVDIATGEFLLPETDLDLPGILPVVLRRTHRSNYRYGRWFGPSWSATLDMRIVVEDTGVTFLGEDGIMLAYPHAEAGTATEPTSGSQRWTCTRTETGGYRIHDPTTEVTRHFAPEPTANGIDARLGNYAISAITDRHHNRIRFHYNDNGAPTEIIHSGGYRILIDTEADRVTALRVIDRGTPITIREFIYNAGELAAVTNAVAATTTYTYDPLHRMTSWTDSNANRMLNTYDPRGRVVAQQGTADILNSTYDYLEFPDGTGTLTTITDSTGAVTTHGFDNDLRLRDLVDPMGAHTHIDYNTDRRPLHVTAPDGAVTAYRYSGTGDIEEITRPDGAKLAIEYASPQRPSRITGPDSTSRRQEWTPTGNLAATTDADGARTEFDYHPTGAVAETISPTGIRTRTETIPTGLPTTITTNNEATTHITRDGFGRPTTVTDALGHQTHYTWSPEGKPLHRTNPDGHTESWTWDGEGNLLTHTTETGATTHYEYGAFDLLSAKTDPDGNTTRYLWDTERRLIAVINPLGHRWTYEYNPSGRLTAETDYTGATTRYTHDRAGRTATITPATGITRHHTHDILGRLTAVTADTGEYLRYTHDRAGRVLTAISGTEESVTHTLRFTYTPTGHLATQQLDNQPPMRHEYDPTGRRTRRTTPTGSVTTWNYDQSGRVRTLTADGHHIDFTHDLLGRTTAWRTGEIAITREFTESGHLTTQEVTAFPARTLTFDRNPGRPSPRQIRRDDYIYRPDGYATTHTITRPNCDPLHREFILDPTCRVTGIYDNGALTEAYSYDALDNITQAETDRGPHPIGAIQTESATDDYREYRDNLLIRAGDTQYFYDLAGRLIRKVDTSASGGPDVWKYRYNALDQLLDVDTPDGQKWHYSYDGLGRRTSKRRIERNPNKQTETAFVWDGTQLIEQHGLKSDTSWQYLPGTYRPITQYKHDTANTQVFVTDPSGTPSELIDSENGETSIITLSLWGRSARRTAESADTPLRLPGQYYDDETGLHYSIFRMFDPYTGRYLTQDPLGLLPSPNPGTYPHNPTRWTDPLGLIPDECEQPLFRGTTEGYGGSQAMQRAGATPTSTDPGVATVFGIHSGSYGEAVLQIALPEDIVGVIRDTGYIRAESEVLLGITPEEFAAKASVSIPVPVARSILEDMGIQLPSRISIEDISALLLDTPKLSSSQIGQFLERAIRHAK